MNIAFAMPPRGGRSSGGYFYNDQLIAGLRTIGHHVHVLESLDELVDGVDVLIEDELGHDRDIQCAAGVRRVALVHVPNVLLDPTADATSEQAFLARCDAAVFVSHTTMKDAGQILDLPRSIVVEPGADHVPLGGNTAHNREVHLVSVAHVTPHKGIVELIDVYERLLVATASWTATICGSLTIDEDYARDVVARIEEAGLTARVTLTGEQTLEQVRDVMETADAFVSTSRYESYGIAATEAMACGVPVFTWAKGGLADVVGVGGVCVALGDADALANALHGIALDRRRHGRLRQRALERARRLPTWAGCAQRWSHFLKQLG